MVIEVDYSIIINPLLTERSNRSYFPDKISHCTKLAAKSHLVVLS